MKCQICEENEAYITARKGNGDLVDCCKPCLSEHFGQIRVDVFGEIKIKNDGPYYFLVEVEPDNLRTALEEFFETTVYVRDPGLNFSTEVGPKIKHMLYSYDKYAQVYVLNIEYEWEEV